MSQLPSVSVIIPVYNDRDGIETTLRSLAGQAFGSDVSVLVVDNNSTDSTPAFLRSYSETHDWVEYLTETEIQSSYAARNTGIEASESELLAFVDADMRVPDGWVTDIREAVVSRDADYLGCNVELVIEGAGTVFDRYDQHTGFPIEAYIETQQFCPTCCLVVRRSVIDDVGLFDDRLVSGGDKEFGNRVAAAGYTLEFAEDIVLSHPTRSSFRALVKKDLRVGKGLAQLQKLYPDRYGRTTPKPSGAKAPRKQDDRSSGSVGNRAIFSVIGTVMVGMRGIGYAVEKTGISGTRN